LLRLCSHAELEHVLAEVQALALTDDLTTLYNRRGFFTIAAQQMKVAKSYRSVDVSVPSSSRGETQQLAIP
jgi:PleD family two-component response regulator